MRKSVTRMNWLAKLVNDKSDEFVKAKLLKYGIGEHMGPRVELRLSDNRITFKADLDLEKIFIRAYLQGAPKGKHKVKGQLVSYQDRIDEFDNIDMPLSWKKSSGKGARVYKCKLNEVAPLEHIQELLEKDGPTTFFLLSLNPSDGAKPWKVTTKTSFPKQGQDADEEDLKSPTFCKGALDNSPEVYSYIMSEVLPSFTGGFPKSAKKIDVTHTIDIKDIKIPDDSSMSFSEKRKKARKIGILTRIVSIDGKEVKDEYNFDV